MAAGDKRVNPQNISPALTLQSRQPGMFHASHEFSAPTPVSSRPGRPSLLARLATVLGIAVLCGAGLALWVGPKYAERSAIQSLPPAERASLLSRTLANLRLCADDPDAMTAFCAEQGHLALTLPECDEPCQLLAGQAVRPRR